jgi:hypothetical protein
MIAFQEIQEHRRVMPLDFFLLHIATTTIHELDFNTRDISPFEDPDNLGD